MAELSIQVEGVKEAVEALGRLELQKRAAMRGAVARTLVDGEAHLKRLLSEPGSGRVYTRRSVSHQASAPSEAPAPDTGVYRNSWHRRTHAGGQGGELYTAQERADALEYGSEDGTLKPRPHAGPTAEHMAADFVTNSKRALARATA